MTDTSNKGFTLIEVMTVLAVIGILAAIAYPSYQDSIRKGRRAEAKGALSQVAAKLQQYYGDNKQYPAAGSDMTDIGYGTATFDTQDGHYTVSFSAVGPTAYTVQAVPQGGQANDTICATYTLTNSGARGVSGSGNVDLCW